MEKIVNTGPPDNTKINVEENDELEYWSNEFGISREQLIYAIKAGRTSAAAVEEYVKNIQK